MAAAGGPFTCGGVAWGHNGALPTGHHSFTLVTEDGRFASVVTNTNRMDSKPSSFDVADKALCWFTSNQHMSGELPGGKRRGASTGPSTT